jgi:hypothetical protein
MAMISPWRSPHTGSVRSGTAHWRPASLDKTNPPVPANAAWARDTCPANPVSSTSDKLTMAMIIEVMIPKR